MASGGRLPRRPPSIVGVRSPSRAARSEQNHRPPWAAHRQSYRFLVTLVAPQSVSTSSTVRASDAPTPDGPSCRKAGNCCWCPGTGDGAASARLPTEPPIRPRRRLSLHRHRHRPTVGDSAEKSVFGESHSRDRQTRQNPADPHRRPIDVRIVFRADDCDTDHDFRDFGGVPEGRSETDHSPPRPVDKWPLRCCRELPGR